MRDEGSARREPTGYKVRRALARRQPRPSPRSIREKRTTCRLPLTGNAPYKGRGRRVAGAGRAALAAAQEDQLADGERQRHAEAQGPAEEGLDVGLEHGGASRAEGWRTAG